MRKLVVTFLIYSVLACLPGEPGPTQFTLVFGGDVMLGRGVTRALHKDWDAAFAGVQPQLAEADLAFANLESPLTSAPQTSGRYDLRAPPQAVALRAAGFDVISLANNHALDAGEAGLAETVATLSAAGIEGIVDGNTGQWPTGGRKQLRFTAAYPLLAVQMLAFDDSTAPLDLRAASRAVACAAGQADLVIVSVHWGGEYQAAPSQRQRAVARALAEAGADLIVGHGPHVLQRMEWLEETLVAYSLGNLLFDQAYPVDCRWGILLRVTVQGHRIRAVEPLPTVTERGQVRLANSEAAAVILARVMGGQH
jgi:poly-gamma-glutamate capsule biosynthesis protein CapA/YwtB (metallophosphatase superfamily)